MPENPRIVSSAVAYRGRLFDLHMDEFALPGGRTARREIIRHPGAVCMIPIDAEGRLLLVTQYRHAAGKRLLELPAGTLEPGEDPAETAVRELQEEVGMRPSVVEPMGGFYVAPSYTSEYIYLFACSGLEPARLEGDEDEDIEVEVATVAEALAAIESGAICDAKTVIGILRWVRNINR